MKCPSCGSEAVRLTAGVMAVFDSKAWKCDLCRVVPGIAAASERAKIVAWLREMSWRQARELGLQSGEAQSCVAKIADAIERGEHDKEIK